MLAYPPCIKPQPPDYQGWCEVGEIGTIWKVQVDMDIKIHMIPTEWSLYLVYKYIYALYTHRHLYINIHICNFAAIYRHPYICLQIFRHITFLYVHIYIYILYINVSIHTNIHIYIYICIFIFRCTHMYIYHIYVWMSMYPCTHSLQGVLLSNPPKLPGWISSHSWHVFFPTAAMF